MQKKTTNYTNINWPYDAITKKFNAKCCCCGRYFKMQGTCMPYYLKTAILISSTAGAFI